MKRVWEIKVPHMTQEELNIKQETIDYMIDNWIKCLNENIENTIKKLDINLKEKEG